MKLRCDHPSCTSQLSNCKSANLYARSTCSHLLLLPFGQGLTLGVFETFITVKKKYNLYLPSAVFIAQVLVGPSKQLKQIIQI